MTISDDKEPRMVFISKPNPLKWRAIDCSPTLAPGSDTFRNRLRMWWGQDVWFHGWPMFKIQGAVNAVLLWRSFR